MTAKFAPFRERLKAEELSLKTQQDKLGQNRKRKLEWLPWRSRAERRLARDIDHKAKVYRRHEEDARAEFANEQQRLVDAIAKRMKSVLTAYADDSGYSLIVADDQPLAVAPGVTTEDITKDLVKRYDDTFAATRLESEGRRVNH